MSSDKCVYFLFLGAREGVMLKLKLSLPLSTTNRDLQQVPGGVPWLKSDLFISEGKEFVRMNF